MKKWMALLLAAILCLSLTACGGNSSSPSQLFEKYQDIIINLENGNYQNAIDLIQHMAEQNSTGTSGSTSDSESKPSVTPEQKAWQTNAVGTWIPDEDASKEGHTGFTVNADGTCVLDGKNYTWVVGRASETGARLEIADGQTKVYNIEISINSDYGYKRATLYKYTNEQSSSSMLGGYYRTEDHTVVKITNDNWQEYFELKEVLSAPKNAFGEVSEFYGQTYLRLKDSFGSANATLSYVAVEYQFVSTCQDITVDLTKMTYTPVGEVKNTSDHRNIAEMRNSTDNNSARYYGVTMGSFTAYDVDQSLTDTVWRPLNHKILRVQGTMYLIKK